MLALHAALIEVGDWCLSWRSLTRSPNCDIHRYALTVFIMKGMISIETFGVSYQAIHKKDFKQEDARITYHKWSSCAIFHFSLFIFHFSVCYWKMKYKVKDTEKWKVKSEKWKAKVKNESHVYVGIGTLRPFFTFHFSFFTFQFVTEKWKPKWKILKNENTKWKVIIDFRNELYLFFILCLKTRNFLVNCTFIKFSPLGLFQDTSEVGGAYSVFWSYDSYIRYLGIIFTPRCIFFAKLTPLGF